MDIVGRTNVTEGAIVKAWISETRMVKIRASAATSRTAGARQMTIIPTEARISNCKARNRKSWPRIGLKPFPYASPGDDRRALEAKKTDVQGTLVGAPCTSAYFSTSLPNRVALCPVFRL